MPQSCSKQWQRRRNFLAACTTVFSILILYTSFDPVPAGEEIPLRSRADLSPIIPEAPVPLPVRISTEAESSGAAAVEENAVVRQQDTSDAQPVSVVDGAMLNSLDTIKFCNLLLKDGADFLRGIERYSVKFHREERIDGDLKAPQSISMKVQHQPVFAVYMRWDNGERGRQVLYSDAYDDKCMVVKFGGFKKLLPALKIDPHCANAKAESRYPVTQAGILGMLNQITEHRDRDLKRGYGVTCRRLEDQVFDERQCYSFLIRYDDAQLSETYRKSLILVDSRHHIPLLVRNFTWATDAEHLSEEELDSATLIENYSFTGFDPERELVAEDFSRSNPTYRM